MAVINLQQNGDPSEIFCPVSFLGTRTTAPVNAISKLSFYLKCCISCCELNLLNREQRSLLEILTDYENAPYLPYRMQEIIFRLACTTFDIEKMILNQNFIVDESHIVLEAGLMNTFFEIHTQSHCQNHVSQRKIMICDTVWIEEFYLDPLYCPQNRIFFDQEERE